MGKINNDTMRVNNINLVLNTIRKAQEISRTELARRLHLTAPAVTNIVGNLLDHHMVREVGCEEAALGRKPVSIGIDPQACFVIGVEVSTLGVLVAMMDYNANILYREQKELDLQGDEQTIMGTILAATKACITASGVDTQKILAIGIASPGPMDVAAGTMLDPPNFPNFRNVPVRRIMEEAFGLPTVLDKETNAAALAEYYARKDMHAKTLFALKGFSASLGGGFLRSGEIVHGFCDGVGDIGHIMVDSNGPRCTCGQYGCMESLATADATLARAKSRLKRKGVQELPGVGSLDDMTVDDMIRLSQKGNTVLRNTIDETLDYLASGLGSVISLMSPETILIGGRVIDRYPEIVDQIRDRIYARAYPATCKRICVEPFLLGSEASIKGAALLALMAFQTRLCA